MDGTARAASDKSEGIQSRLAGLKGKRVGRGEEGKQRCENENGMHCRQ